jgi:predicted mannosyl-3-phosphoglycerate phosphatase (HAD superfamily)
MDFEPIISSGLVGGLALIGVIYQARKSRDVNTREHEENSTKLSEISQNVTDIRDKVDHVNDRLTDHIANHHKKWWQR